MRTRVWSFENKLVRSKSAYSEKVETLANQLFDLYTPKVLILEKLAPQRSRVILQMHDVLKAVARRRGILVIELALKEMYDTLAPSATRRKRDELCQAIGLRYAPSFDHYLRRMPTTIGASSPPYIWSVFIAAAQAVAFVKKRSTQK